MDTPSVRDLIVALNHFADDDVVVIQGNVMQDVDIHVYRPGENGHYTLIWDSSQGINPNIDFNNIKRK